jgi:hypothetical protein
MTDTALRARVERLLRGDFRVDDITRLFLYARDRCDGRESIQEVGDFVAHHNERTKGLLTKTTKDWFSIAKFWGATVQAPISLDNLPNTLPDFLAANLRRKPRIIHPGTNITRREAESRLPHIISNFVHKADGSLAISLAHTWDDINLITLLVKNIVVKGAFNDDRLCDDLSSTLRTLGLLKREELAAFKKLKPLITLFAVSVMHNCEIVISDGSRIRLKAAAPADGHIVVSAPIPIPTSRLVGADHFMLSAAMFTTKLDTGFCEPELVQNPEWNFSVEVTLNIRLGKLG